MPLWGDRKVSDVEALLLKQNEDLHKQVERLQEALIAKESPVAYQQMLADKIDYENESEVNGEERERVKLERDFIRRAAIAQEQPFFRDTDDMQAKLGRMIGVNPPPSLHNNEES